MKDRVGELAGYVWRFLEDEGETSVSGVSKNIDAPKSKVDMALGWLARENKIEFVEKSRGRAVRLK